MVVPVINSNWMRDISCTLRDQEDDETDVIINLPIRGVWMKSDAENVDVIIVAVNVDVVNRRSPSLIMTQTNHVYKMSRA